MLGTLDLKGLEVTGSQLLFLEHRLELYVQSGLHFGIYSDDLVLHLGIRKHWFLYQTYTLGSLDLKGLEVMGSQLLFLEHRLELYVQSGLHFGIYSDDLVLHLGIRKHWFLYQTYTLGSLDLKGLEVMGSQLLFLEYSLACESKLDCLGLLVD